MKKVLLGLILSAGMSGVAFASSDVKFDKVADCTINTQVITTDANGNEISNEVVITTGTGAECSSAMNGTVYALLLIRKRGPVKQINSIQP